MCTNNYLKQIDGRSSSVLLSHARPPLLNLMISSCIYSLDLPASWRFLSLFCVSYFTYQTRGKKILLLNSKDRHKERTELNKKKSEPRDESNSSWKRRKSSSRNVHSELNQISDEDGIRLAFVPQSNLIVSTSGTSLDEDSSRGAVVQKEQAMWRECWGRELVWNIWLEVEVAHDENLRMAWLHSSTCPRTLHASMIKCIYARFMLIRTHQLNRISTPPCLSLSLPLRRRYQSARSINTADAACILKTIESRSTVLCVRRAPARQLAKGGNYVDSDCFVRSHLSARFRGCTTIIMPLSAASDLYKLWNWQWSRRENGIKKLSERFKSGKSFFSFSLEAQNGIAGTTTNEGNCSARLMGEPRELQHQQTQCPGPSRP